MMDPESPSLTGQVLDSKYRVQGILGRGAMGLVYEGKHLLLGKEVAIKVLRPELSMSPELRGRFEAEARAAAAIGHGNIVAVTDMGRTREGALYFVMDRLRGETLGERLARRGRLDFLQAVAIAVEVLAGLEAAHALGIIHRDLKPDNVFLQAVPGGQEAVKILDFGLAKALLASAAHPGTQAGMVVGTPEYMAPEQARGEPDLDPRVDLYAVGALLYRMLSGRRPYDGDNPLGVLARVLSGPPPALGELCPHAPPELISLTERAMARERAARPRSARELREQLMGLLPAPVLPLSTLGAVAVEEGAAPASAEHSASVYSITALGGEMIEPPTFVHRDGPLPTRLMSEPAHGRPEEPPAPTRLVAAPPAPARAAPDARPDGAAPKVEEQDQDGDEERGDPPGTPQRFNINLEHSFYKVARAAGAARSSLFPIAVLLLVIGLYLGWPALSGMLGLIDKPGQAGEAAAPPPITYRPLARDDAVLLDVRVQPARSRLLLDGTPLQSNPMRLPRSDEEHELSALADGYEPQTIRFRPDRPKTLQIKLRRKRSR